MTREEAKAILENDIVDGHVEGNARFMDAFWMAVDALSQEPKTEWIPLKTRPMTEEESTYYRDWAEYGAEMFDCPLPDDGQEVLISWGGMVCVDTFVNDSDGCYFEGVEIEDVEAWQPLPEAYKVEPQKSEG